MKKFFKTAMLMTAAVLLAFSFNSCKKSSKTTEPTTDTDAVKVAIINQFLDHTVSPTYTKLAFFTDELVNDLKTLKSDMTQANVDKSCESFLEARKWWEMSESFLFGAASDFGIDPHIDSWPLDEDAFNNLMASPSMIAALDSEDGDVIAGEQLGNALLGFHGIEYVLFRDGQPRNVADLTNDDMIYAVAVSGDLRNRCFQLEVSWLGDNAPTSHREKMEELEFNTTVNGGDNSYGDNMRKAGKAGSTYSTLTQALQSIIDGSIDISDEVGTSKIGKPHTGEDPTYVESPYSQKSIIDFCDNITSIKNAYMGGNEGERDESKSLHAYVKNIDSQLDNRIVEAIDNALVKINNMVAPFVYNYTDPSAGEAMEACQNLSDVLAEAKDAIKDN